VTYCVAPAHESGLADRSVDLITVAQAAHWFDLEPFYAEVRRVAHPGGVIALWCYHLPEILPAADFILRDFEEHVLKDNWSPGARLLHEHYRAIPFPFAPIDAAGGPESRSAGSQSTPEFTSVTSWDLSELLGHLSSWSAAQRFRETRGGDPLDEVRDRLRAAWGDPEMKRPVRWPLYLRVGRVG
jgi:SAM-dependent methyltransferase